jgi:hypothetical protein
MELNRMSQNKPIIAGKKPLSSKPKGPTNYAQTPNFFKNKLNIPEDVATELASKQLEGRWINYKKYVDDGNSHDKGWAVYRAPKRETTDTLVFGTSPDGIIRRGDSVLACRPLSQGNEHRAWLQYRAKAQASGFRKSAAEELRQMARDASVDAEIVEGYEENDTN